MKNLNGETTKNCLQAWKDELIALAKEKSEIQEKIKYASDQITLYEDTSLNKKLTTFEKICAGILPERDENEELITHE